MAAGLALAFTGAPVPVSAEDAGIRDGARTAGHAVGSVAREIGQGAKKVGKTVGGAAKEGGKEFRRALKGQSG
jgi:hypothetical protein